MTCLREDINKFEMGSWTVVFSDGTCIAFAVKQMCGCLFYQNVLVGQFALQPMCGLIEPGLLLLKSGDLLSMILSSIFCAAFVMAALAVNQG